LVKATIARLPEGSEIVAAFDADAAGRKLVELVRMAVAAVAAETGSRSLIFHVHLPALEGQDWNQVLQEHSQGKEKPPGTGVPISGSSCIGNGS
jgi:DNA primase